MNKQSFGIYYLILLLTFSIGGCSSTKKAPSQSQQFAALYNPSEYSMNADFKLYHINDELSSLYIRLYPGQLLFNQANEDAEMRAMVQIDYSLFELDEEGVIIAKADSGRYEYKLLERDQAHTAFFRTRVLQIMEGKKYLLRLDTKDLQRGTVGLKHLYVDKSDPYSSQNFNVLSARSNYPRFMNYFTSGEIFRLIYREPLIDTLYLDFYRASPLMPRPQVFLDSPSEFVQDPDTTFTIIQTDSTVLALPERGRYHVRIDTTQNSGISLFNYGPDFPLVKSEEAMLGPIFYVATMTEFQLVSENPNRKRAVDDFWMKRSTSIDRSRELIRIYYNRVLYSNLYFTSNREGWKTDRGMLFILFGPPDRMKDSGQEQRWYYISRKQGKVIEFVFKRELNPYSNQVLVWQKDNESMRYWSAAVSSWRSGKAYSLGK